MKARSLLLLLLAGLIFDFQVIAAPATITDNGPRRYEAVSSLVFQYRWLKFPALGVISVDTRTRSFAIEGLSQIGIGVFELSDKNGVIKCHMPGNLLKRNPRFATGAANDVMNLFLDLVPPPGARLRETTTSWIYTQDTSAGSLEYQFDKATGLLGVKRLSRSSNFLPWCTVIWEARYQNYARIRGRTCAKVVLFKNRKFHYAISTRVREMRILQ